MYYIWRGKKIYVFGDEKVAVLVFANTRTNPSCQKFCHWRKVEFNQPFLLALFRAKFACILAIRNPVFRCESCKGSVCERV